MKSNLTARNPASAIWPDSASRSTLAAVVIFWPAAFFLGGDKQTAAGRMKGQIVAVEQASITKKCGIQFQGERPPGTWCPALTGHFRIYFNRARLRPLTSLLRF
jgi:hypothetical protein